MTKTTGKFKSANGVNNIAYYIYAPDAAQPTPSAIVQISHGMTEYVERYEHFAAFLCDNGVVMCGNEHLGHKGSVTNDSELGFFADKAGYKCVVEDVHNMTRIIKERYPHLPCVLLGHSMGSFVARLYLQSYGDELCGAVLCGTNGGSPLVGAGIVLSSVIIGIRGKHYRSKLLKDISFGNYNDRFPKEEGGNAWLSRDAEIRRNYEADKYCTFRFTTSAYRDLFTMIKLISAPQWAASVPKTLPIFIISGDMDPVGDFSVGVKRVYEALKAAGANVTLKLYEGARHELINEVDCETVHRDLLNFVRQQASEFAPIR